MVCKSFDEFPRNELLVAKDNLAEVFRYGLDADVAQDNPAHMWHIMGNFLLATAATLDTGSLGDNLEDGVITALTAAGEPEESAADLAEKMTDIDVMRHAGRFTFLTMRLNSSCGHAHASWMSHVLQRKPLRYGRNASRIRLYRAMAGKCLSVPTYEN